MNGDFFCLMQGRGDPRRSKDDILPEHNNGRYLDSVVDTAVEWFAPYAEQLLVLGYGNHETSIIQYQETDILLRFATILNHIGESVIPDPPPAPKLDQERIQVMNIVPKHKIRLVRLDLR